MGGDILFDFFYSQMIGSFQRAHGRAENLRHLFVLHFIIILHVEDKTLFLGEGGDDLSEFQSQLVAVDIFVALDKIDKMTLLVIEAQPEARR